MNIEEAVAKIGIRFRYKSDKKTVIDSWRAMEPEEDGHMYGDCDDFAITSLWYHADRNKWKFALHVLITGKYKLYKCTTATGVDHIIGSVGDLYFDNWTRAALPKDKFFAATGHKIDYRVWFPLPMLIRGWVQK